MKRETVQAIRIDLEREGESDLCLAVGKAITFFERIEDELETLSWWKRLRLSLALPILRELHDLLCGSLRR